MTHSSLQTPLLSISKKVEFFNCEKIIFLFAHSLGEMGQWEMTNVLQNMTGR
jgi:hypothetical protein